jgi:hypothetical protein
MSIQQYAGLAHARNSQPQNGNARGLREGLVHRFNGAGEQVAGIHLDPRGSGAPDGRGSSVSNRLTFGGVNHGFA